MGAGRGPVSGVRSRNRSLTRRQHPHYAAGTVRGTKWLTEDRCGSTRVKVARGRAAVQDLVRKRTRVVRAGRSLTVRAKR